MLPHGVTFLAFGNGAPDIFSALVAFSDPRTAGLAIGALFGEHSSVGVWSIGGSPEYLLLSSALLSSRRRSAGHHCGGWRHHHSASLHGCVQAFPQGHRFLYGGCVSDLHCTLSRQDHAGLGTG